MALRLLGKNYSSQDYLKQIGLGAGIAVGFEGLGLLFGSGGLRAPAEMETVHRFATSSDPSTLLPNLSRAGRFTQARVNFLMKFQAYRAWRAHSHMRGMTLNSPFVSVLKDPLGAVTSTDPWLRTIATGSPGASGVRRAPDLGAFEVPSSRLTAPRAENTLSIEETELLFEGRDLETFLKSWQKNPH